MSAAAHEFRALSRLAVPVVITQVATMLPGVVDIVMVGRVSVDAINAVALGRLWLFGTLLFGMGVVFGIDPLIAQAHGRRDERTMGLALQRGAVLAALISIPITGLWLLTAPVLRLFGQDPAFARLAQDYVWIQIPGLLPFLLYIVLRQYLQDRAIVRPVMWVTLGSTAVNVAPRLDAHLRPLGRPGDGGGGSGRWPPRSPATSCSARWSASPSGSSFIAGGGSRSPAKRCGPRGCARSCCSAYRWDCS